jgi:hypothetical protein
MTTTAPSPWQRCCPLVLIAAGVLGGASPARAQQTVIDWNRQPVLPSGADLSALDASAAEAKPHRIRLFRVQPGFLSDPVGLFDRDDKDPLRPELKAAEQDSSADWVNVSIGYDNPYFDFRQPGDPGGIGFYKVNTQVQLFDSRSTACAIGLQAVTPAGLQFDGLPERLGPTVFTPALSVFQALDDTFVIQGFVGKNLTVQQAATQPVRRNLEYGMALQRPLVPNATDALRNLYLSVGALGQYRLDRDAAGSTMVWDVLPGFHWKLADNWWVSGGVLVPITPSPKSDVNRWQFTCSFQF